ncbi:MULTISPECIES: MarR family winged helix-turn-helix transcriptional regulator [unclassified Streptomyces]|uniref:MarR family winged helix-turn-helix transcriptional regulator n=1 Tax=unclassified Streptomyces TaxID=2593676 RepID=UPI0025560185|nr:MULTISPECIES: MarR family transcriptional regulator [unclassified Streptomyces]WRZ69081.1 MarR family transcriptional regulator [Streptomyces sp. NBC_01257]WSU63029.1 MarR family transcriptional regulator [Streptomyces sp. NBC_01104]
MGQRSDDAAVLARLRTVTMWLSRQMREPSAVATSITPSRHSTLWSVDKFGPLRMTDLARLEKISKSSVTRIVSNLAADGLVEVTSDVNDGRSTLVGMTPEGTRVLAATSERTDTFFLSRLADFSEAERVMLDAAVMLLERLVAPADGLSAED